MDPGAQSLDPTVATSAAAASATLARGTAATTKLDLLAPLCHDHLLCDEDPLYGPGAINVVAGIEDFGLC